MTHNTVEACEIISRLDHNDKLDDSIHGKKQKAATASNYMRRTLLGQSPYVLLEFLDHSVAFALHRL